MPGKPKPGNKGSSKGNNRVSGDKGNSSKDQGNLSKCTVHESKDEKGSVKKDTSKEKEDSTTYMGESSSSNKASATAKDESLTVKPDDLPEDNKDKAAVKGNSSVDNKDKAAVNPDDLSEDNKDKASVNPDNLPEDNKGKSAVKLDDSSVDNKDKAAVNPDDLSEDNKDKASVNPDDLPEDKKDKVAVKPDDLPEDIKGKAAVNEDSSVDKKGSAAAKLGDLSVDKKGKATVKQNDSSVDKNGSPKVKNNSSVDKKGSDTEVMDDSSTDEDEPRAEKKGRTPTKSNSSTDRESFKMKDPRNFKVVIYEKDYKELCAWVLKRENIETGGDLFGLWADKRTAAIQLVLGPGNDCRRTSVSFYQDVPYLERVGSYLTQHEGLCHIGEWHSHHRLGLARPSGGDERTVWSNMPSYKLNRFVIFIANIEPSRKSESVNIGCFLFEIDGKSGRELQVLQGKFEILSSRSPFSAKPEVFDRICDGAESTNKEDDLGELAIEKTESVGRQVHCVRKPTKQVQVKRKGEKKQDNPSLEKRKSRK